MGGAGTYRDAGPYRGGAVPIGDVLFLIGGPVAIWGGAVVIWGVLCL